MVQNATTPQCTSWTEGHMAPDKHGRFKAFGREGRGKWPKWLTIMASDEGPGSQIRSTWTSNDTNDTKHQPQYWHPRFFLWLLLLLFLMINFL